jgi:UDP-N-acetylglucosamine 4,6-dehydratase
MAKAEDVGPYYRIPADNRDSNYDRHFVEGQMLISQIEAFTSHNTERLDIEQVKTLLMTLEYIQGELRA